MEGISPNHLTYLGAEQEVNNNMNVWIILVESKIKVVIVLLSEFRGNL